MRFRKVLIQQGNYWDTEKEDHFFVIKLEFDNHNHVFVVWKEHNIDTYEQLLFACKDLKPENFPIELKIRIEGIVHSIQIPEYSVMK